LHWKKKKTKVSYAIDVSYVIISMLVAPNLIITTLYLFYNVRLLHHHRLNE